MQNSQTSPAQISPDNLNLENNSLKNFDPEFDPEKVQLRQATHADVPNLVALLDRCYRSDEGWTNEAGLIGGIRTTPAEIQKMLENDSIYLFVYDSPNEADGLNTTEVLACISVDFTPKNGKPAAYIGTFAVVPELQGKGVGNILLNAVETFVTRHAKARSLTHFSMSILSHRPELLAYYQRRGYHPTGEIMDFPTDGNNGEPKRHDLYLAMLEKPIA